MGPANVLVVVDTSVLEVAVDEELFTTLVGGTVDDDANDDGVDDAWGECETGEETDSFLLLTTLLP